MKSILEILTESGSWMGMSELLKLSGKERKEAVEELAALKAKGLVDFHGEKKGRKYAAKGTVTPEATPSDLSGELLKLLTQHKVMSRKEMCENLKTYDAKIMPSLNALLEAGTVVSNGKSKGQLFAHVSNKNVFQEMEKQKVEEEKKKQKEKVEKWLTGEKDSEEVPERKFASVLELVQEALKQFAGRKKKYTITELAETISNSFRAHGFTHWEIIDQGISVERKRENSLLKFEMIKDMEGQRVMYWVEKVNK